MTAGAILPFASVLMRPRVTEPPTPIFRRADANSAGLRADSFDRRSSHSDSDEISEPAAANLVDSLSSHSSSHSSGSGSGSIPVPPNASTPRRDRKVPAPPGLDPETLLKTLDVPDPAPCDVIHHMQMKPGIVKVESSWSDKFRSAMRGKFVDLRLLCRRHIDCLSDAQLIQFLDAIAEQQQVVRYVPTRSRRHRWHLPIRSLRRKDISAISALALQFYVRGHVDLVSRMMAVRPVRMARDLNEIAPNIFSVETISTALRIMIKDITGEVINWDYPEVIQADALGNMIEAFLIVHANFTTQVIEAWLTALLVKLEGSGFALTSENLGCLAGAVLSGGHKYVRWIKAKDEARYYKIDKGFQLVWASSSALYPFPVVGAVGSLAAVLVGIFFEKRNPVRDFSNAVKQVEGNLRVRLDKEQIFRSEYRINEFIRWLELTMRCNSV